MNISYNWLKDLIDIDLTADELAQKLTDVGLAVEGVHPHGDDFVLDIDLTSNRPDCLSHLGVARELRVFTGKELNAEPQKHGDNEEIPVPAILAADMVRIEDPALCHRFTARIIRNVKIAPSPEWLVNRLEAIGERSINNVADITNYVMHELGQPMHSFDLDKLSENRIVVRKARYGETIKTLDEVDRKLDDSMLAICDAEKPVAVAGVMGGLDSSITENTVNVLLEVAFFKRENIRQTSRKLGLATEASYRFERGVDIEALVRASNRATELICDLADGEASDFIDVYPTKFLSKEIESNDISASLKRLTGLNVAESDCKRILNALGIINDKQSNLSNPKSQIFVPPSWRHDLAIEEDLVEEIARHAGYQNIAEELPPAYGAGEYQEGEVRKKLLRQSLVDIGFDEALSYSFIDTKFDDIFDIVPGVLDIKSEEKYVGLRDSVIEGSVRMRPTLLPGLLEAVRLNFNYQRRDVRLFEIGKVFAANSGEDDLPTERELLSLLLTGTEVHENRAADARELDFYDAKGALEAALDSVGVANAEFHAVNVKHLRKGQSASVHFNGKNVGFLGRVNEEIATDYKFRQAVYVAEIDLQTILAKNVSPILYSALPKYPSVIRDVSFLVPRSLSFAEIRNSINTGQAVLCRNIQFVDVFEGKGIPADQRSLTVRLEYRSDERTLLEEEVNTVHDQILQSLESSLSIKPRI